MTRKATHKEIHQQLPDYVLGLLAPGQAEKIADHLAGCAACRETVLGEREIGALLRSSLAVTTRPDATRLPSLMPPIPRQTMPGGIAANWTTRLAPVLVVLAVILGSILISAPDAKRPMSLFSGATATATSTNTPTATIAQESGSASAQTSADRAIRSAALPAAVMESPAPVQGAPAPLMSPTPVVASSQMAAN